MSVVSNPFERTVLAHNARLHRRPIINMLSVKIYNIQLLYSIIGIRLYSRKMCIATRDILLHGCAHTVKIYIYCPYLSDIPINIIL